MTSTGQQIDDAVAKRHIQNTDTALGVQSSDLDMNLHKIIGLKDPVGDRDGAHKKFVLDNVGGGGDVAGPGSAIDSAIPLFDGITGKLLKDSTRLIEDVLSDGSDIPDGHAIKTYGDANWSGEYTNLVEFISQTAWRLFYSNAAGDVTELALGTSGQYLKATGIDSIPMWDIPSGGGDVLGPATNTDDYVPQWDGTDSKTLKGGFAITAAGKALVDDANVAAQRATLGLLSAALRNAEDTLTDGANLPDGAAIKTYGDANWGGSYTNLTEFVSQTAWRLFYSNNLGDVIELALGTSGQYLKTNGIDVAPTWSVPSGAGDVVGPATNTDNYVPQWNGADSKTLENGFAITVAGKALLDDANAAAQRTTLGLLSAALRNAEDTLTDGANLPDGHAIKTYGDSHWNSGGYTNLTEFVSQTAWRLFYSDGAGDVTELALGTSGQYLKANGISSIPTWDTPSSDSLWTDEGTYIYPSNWSNLKIYDSGRLDMSSSQWVYDDDSISYTGIGCGQIHRYNQLIKNFTMNHSQDQVLARIEGKSSGGHDALALMTAIQLTGTGQGWGSNPMIDIESTWQPTSGKWAVGEEIDLNLRSNTANGLTQGLMIVGISTYAPTVAMTISMGTTDWKDGIWMSNISNNGIIFLSNPAPGTGIRFDYPCSNANFWQNSGDMKFHDPNAGTKTLSQLAAGGGGLSNIVEDTTPELGGSLYCNAHGIVFNNNETLYWKNTGESFRIGMRLNSSNDWNIGFDGGGVFIGTGCVDANPIFIKVGGTNNKQIFKSPDTDSQGKHYLVVT